MNTSRIFLITAFFILASFTESRSDLSPYEVRVALKGAEKARGGTWATISSSTRTGKAFFIRDLKKPAVVSFVYTSCPHTCATIAASLRNVFDGAGEALGDKFVSLTIGFDSVKDTPAAMKAFGGNFTDDFKAWRFASSDGKTIEALAKDFGFLYRKTDSGFDHLNMATVVDQKGSIVKSFFFPDFKKEEMLEALMTAGERAPGEPGGEKISGFVDLLKYICYTYDETTGTYRVDYAMLMGISLGLLAQATIAGLIVYIFKGGKAKRARSS